MPMLKVVMVSMRTLKRSFLELAAHLLGAANFSLYTDRAIIALINAKVSKVAGI